MTGIEYAHIHAQEPILYVIRKQMRHSPTQGKMHFQLVLWKGFMEESIYVLRNLKLRQLSVWCWTYFFTERCFNHAIKNDIEGIGRFLLLAEKKLSKSFGKPVFFLVQILILTCFSNITSNLLHSWWGCLPSSWYWISYQLKAGMDNCLSYKFLSK